MTKSNSAESAPNETSPLLTNDRLVSDTCDNIAGYDTNGSPSPSIEDGMLAEFKLILGYTLPLTGTYLLQYSYNIILLFVVASLGTTELAAVSVGVMTTNIIGYAIFEGIATSLDTLCSQAYGSGKYILVGVYVQQVFLLLMLVSVPIALLWVFSPFILVYLVKDQAVASMAGTFLGYSALGIPGYAAFEVGKRFLQAQGDFQGGFVALITSVPLLIFFNWLFVYICELGLIGAALAIVLFNSVRPLILVLYIYFWVPWTLQCWPGIFRFSVFDNWRPVILLSFNGAIMTVFEWFTFEIMTFSTSYLGTVPLAAQGILVSVTTVLWHIPFSASIAVSTRIGFFVGRNAILQAKKFTPLYSGFVLVIALFNCGIILIGRGMITRMLGTEEDVSIVVIAVFRFAAIYQVFASTSCLVVGIVRGLGKQSTGALLTLVINHAYTLPVSLFLELGLGKFPGFGLSGLWTGLASGQLVLTISLAIFLRLTHWQLAVEKLISREAGRQSI